MKKSVTCALKFSDFSPTKGALLCLLFSNQENLTVWYEKSLVKKQNIQNKDRKFKQRKQELFFYVFHVFPTTKHWNHQQLRQSSISHWGVSSFTDIWLLVIAARDFISIHLIMIFFYSKMLKIHNLFLLQIKACYIQVIHIYIVIAMDTTLWTKAFFMSIHFSSKRNEISANFQRKVLFMCKEAENCESTFFSTAFEKFFIY